ncbi:hypothetical protein SLA2020_443150 [Shorea laevis]
MTSPLLPPALRTLPRFPGGSPRFVFSPAPPLPWFPASRLTPQTSPFARPPSLLLAAFATPEREPRSAFPPPPPAFGTAFPPSHGARSQSLFPASLPLP